MKLNTRQKIETIIEEMHKTGSLMTISGVAREAEVHPSTIHNTYPDLAERIRVLAGKIVQKDAKAELIKRRGKIKFAKALAKELREEIGILKKELRKSDSLNLTLTLELQQLQAKYNLLMGKYEKLQNMNKMYISELHR